MYEIFLKLLEERGVTAYKVGKETGIASSTFTDWKTGRSEPKQDKLAKIADYFNVSIDYLMTGKEPDFSIEMAKTDAKLSKMNKKVKEYALKLDSLSEDDKDYIMYMIDKIIDKRGN